MSNVCAFTLITWPSFKQDCKQHTSRQNVFSVDYGKMHKKYNNNKSIISFSADSKLVINHFPIQVLLNPSTTNPSTKRPPTHQPTDLVIIFKNLTIERILFYRALAHLRKLFRFIIYLMNNICLQNFERLQKKKCLPTK